MDNDFTHLKRLWLAYTLSSVQSLSRVRLFATPWIAAHQASLSITNSQGLLKLMSIELVMPSNPLILCCLLLPSIFPMHLHGPKIRTIYKDIVSRLFSVFHIQPPFHISKLFFCFLCILKMCLYAHAIKLLSLHFYTQKNSLFCTMWSSCNSIYHR